MIAEEGKAGRKIGERWSAILVPSPAASDTDRRSTEPILHPVPSPMQARSGMTVGRNDGHAKRPPRQRLT